MKEIKLLSLFVFITVLQLSGQTKDSRIEELLNISNFINDKDAGAVIIFDIGESDFFQSDQGFYTKFTRSLRIKFFNDTELNYAEFDFPLYNNQTSSEIIEEFTANVYNLSDGVTLSTQTTKNELLKETYNKKWDNYKVAVSGVKAGSVMDVSYTIVSPFLFNLHDWQFQYSIPVIYSEYVTKMIPFYTYSYILKGATKLDELSSKVENRVDHNLGSLKYQKTIYKFVKSNIPAFYSDQYISSANDYMISIDFQLSEIYHKEGYKEKVISTWPELSKELLKDENFGIYLRNCKKIAKKVLEENKFIFSNNIQYLEQLVGFVKNNYDWNGNRGYGADLKMNDFLRTKKGNDAAINLFLTALLREAGFTVDPVILSTRDNGKVYVKYPFLHYFNYSIVLANIDGKDYLLDATDKQSFFDQIPIKCINEFGLVVKKDEEKWVGLSSNNLSTETNTFFFQFNENKDSLKCSYKCNTTGYYALTDKTNYKENTEDFVEKEINPLFDEVLNSNVFERDSSKMFRYTALGMIKPTQVDQYISIKPFLNTTMTKNPFAKRTRDYPVDFTFAKKRTFSAQIILPPGAKLVKLPEPFKMDISDFSLNYEVSLTDNAILINAEYSLKRPVYNAILYPGLKNFFENVIKYLNQPIEIEL
jgi:hypothetical protein